MVSIDIFCFYAINCICFVKFACMCVCVFVCVCEFIRHHFKVTIQTPHARSKRISSLELFIRGASLVPFGEKAVQREGYVYCMQTFIYIYYSLCVCMHIA